MVGKVKPCHSTSVKVKRHPKRVYLVEGFPFGNMDRSTVEERVKILLCIEMIILLYQHLELNESVI